MFDLKFKKIDNDKILLLLLIVVVIVCVIFNFKKNDRDMNEVVENFQTKNNTADTDDTDDEEEEDNERTSCPTLAPRQWFELHPVRSLVSRFSGVSFNVCPVESADCTTGTLESNYYVQIETPNNDLPQGVLTVSANGTFSTDIASNIVQQYWKIIKIDATNPITNYLPSTTTVETSNEDYPYYLCLKAPILQNSSTLNITAPNLNRALQYENGSLSVRFLGNYESQKWYINRDALRNLPIMTNNANQYSQFTPEFNQQGTNEQQLQTLNRNNNQQVMSSLNQIMSLLQQQGNVQPPSESLFGNKELSVNVNLGGNKETKSKDTFQDTNQNNENVSELLDKYEKGDIIQKQRDTLNDIIDSTQMKSVQCKIPNFDDYVTVGQMAVCNGCSNL